MSAPEQDDVFREAVSYILSSIETSLSHEMKREIAKTIRLILDANRVFVYGVGRSGLVGQSFAMRLVQLGLKAHFIGEVTTPIVTEKDLVMIISNTGETMSAIQTGNIARRQGAKVIAITSNGRSKLAHTGNVNLIIAPDGRGPKSELAPLGTLFENASQVFLDGLVSQIMRELRESEGSMRGRHAIWV